MLGITDEHPERGLTLFINYRTLNGNLYTLKQVAKLESGQSVAIEPTDLPTTPPTRRLMLDLIYVPDTGNSALTDACFFSVQDKESKAGALASTFLRTNPTKVSFTINPGVVPVVTNSGLLSYLEGAQRHGHHRCGQHRHRRLGSGATDGGACARWHHR